MGLFLRLRVSVLDEGSSDTRSKRTSSTLVLQHDNKFLDEHEWARPRAIVAARV